MLDRQLALQCRLATLPATEPPEAPVGTASVVLGPLDDAGAQRCALLRAPSTAGLAMNGSGCVDLGVGRADDRWRSLAFLPPPSSVHRAVGPRASASAADAQRTLERLQFAAGSCSGHEVSAVGSLPIIGFGQTLEYLLLSLATSARRRTQLVLGRSSSSEWSSGWLCGDERSMRCYSNLSSCCGDRSFDEPRSRSRPPSVFRKTSRRAGGTHRAISFPEHERLGTMWGSGQLAHFYFSRLWPPVRAEIDRRRAGVLPRSPGARLQAIGMHIRRGDSCSLGSRYCPANLTAGYFAHAAALRERYAVNTLLVATDDAEAAALCRGGVLGFDCRTAELERAEYNARTSIEVRVAAREERCGPAGCASSDAFSGSAVALATLADIDMLADCEYLVVVLRSALSRLALALAVARAGRNVPFISVQWPWGGRRDPAPPGEEAGRKFKGMAKGLRAGASRVSAARTLRGDL